MEKLIINTTIFALGILMMATILLYNNKSIEIDAKETVLSTEATTTTSTTIAETITTQKVVKVKNMKVKCKKTMIVKSKQKISINKIRPKNATCKKFLIINKSKKILTIKNKTIKAKKVGIGKIIIKSKDNNFQKMIKIKVKNKPYQGLSFDGIKLQYSGRYHVTSNPLNTRMGVKYFNGAKETYYSQRVLSGGGLRIPGRHVADDGTIRDKDGYIVVATNYSFRAKYSKFLISLGPAKVYDTGCAYGVVDVYCNW